MANIGHKITDTKSNKQEIFQLILGDYSGTAKYIYFFQNKIDHKYSIHKLNQRITFIYNIGKFKYCSDLKWQNYNSYTTATWY